MKFVIADCDQQAIRLGDQTHLGDKFFTNRGNTIGSYLIALARKDMERWMIQLADMVVRTQGVICRKDKDVIDEIPGAYKDIDQVMPKQAGLPAALCGLK